MGSVADYILHAHANVYRHPSISFDGHLGEAARVRGGQILLEGDFYESQGRNLPTTIVAWFPSKEMAYGFKDELEHYGKGMQFRGGIEVRVLPDSPSARTSFGLCREED